MDEDTKQMRDRLYATDDAAVWAEEWVKTARGILDRHGCNPEAIATLPAPVAYAIDALLDEGWMIGWFANAIETAKDLQARALAAESALQEAQDERDEAIKQRQESAQEGARWIAASEAARVEAQERGDREPSLTDLAAEMRSNSERWFPEMHADPQVPLPVFYALGLSGEVGEVANEVKKGVRGHQENGVRHIDLAAELADVFTYLLLLADELGVDLLAEYRTKAAYNESRWGSPAALNPPATTALQGDADG